MGVKTTAAGLLLSVLAMGAIGCGGAAHVVRRGTWSGELALTGSPMDSMSEARMAMVEHCGGRARIVTGDEAVSLAAIDPEIAKADGASVHADGERLHYVCVTLEASAR